MAVHEEAVDQVSLQVPDLPPDADTLTAALAYAEAGFYVGPVLAGTKRPALGGRWQERTSRDPELIAAWFPGTDHGVFLHLGRSGAVAFDVDNPRRMHPQLARAIEEAQPPFQSTRPDQPGRGHYLFAVPDGRSLGNGLGSLRSGWGEVRGRNGLIVVAPTEHPNGGHYEWHTTGPVPLLTPNLADLLPDAHDAADAAPDGVVEAFLRQYSDATRPEMLDLHVDAWRRKVAAGESRHDTMTGHLAGAMKEARAGLLSAQTAAHTLEGLFLAAVTQDGHGNQGAARSLGQAREEWRGLLAWAVGQARAADLHAVRDRAEEVLPDLSGSTLTSAANPPREDATLAASDRDAAFARAVDDQFYRLRVNDAAREKHAAAKAAAVPAPPFDAGLLRDVLGRPAEPPHRVEGLIPTDAATVIAAMRKSGKTTLMLNLARCLITGEPFLGRFLVRPITGRVALLNFEVSAAQIARWADEVGVPQDRLLLVNLRGRRNPLGHPGDRVELAALLRQHQVESVAVDPFGRAYTGQNQNDPGEVGAWLADLDLFGRGEVGVSDVILAVHAGWVGERSRGSSALEDWPDSIITLTRDPNDPSSRFLRAEGRDVDVEEDQLHYDPTARLLSLTGQGSRKQAGQQRQRDELIGALVAVVIDDPGLGIQDITRRLRGQADGPRFRDREVSDASKEAERRGLIRRVSAGAGRKLQHFPPNPVHPVPTPSLDRADGVPRQTPSQPRPGRGPTTPSTPSIRDGVGVGVVQHPRLWDGVGVPSTPAATPAASCSVCGFPLDPVLVRAGDTTHATCTEET